VIERCKQTLKTWLDLARRKEFSRNPKLRVKILLDIAKGMAYLHSRGLLHCDLTSSNILLDEDGTCKLADFGLSRTLQDPFSLTGNVYWAAQEVLPFQGFTKSFSKAIDVFSFGVIVWETFSCLHPGYEFEDVQEFLKAVRNEHYTLPIPSDCPNIWKQLIHDCCQLVPEQRPSFEALVQRLRQMDVKESYSGDIMTDFLDIEGGYID